MDVAVRKTNGSYEEYDKIKLMNGIREAYKTAGEECPEAVVVSIAENGRIQRYMNHDSLRQRLRPLFQEEKVSLNFKDIIANWRKKDDE